MNENKEKKLIIIGLRNDNVMKSPFWKFFYHTSGSLNIIIYAYVFVKYVNS